MIEFDLNKLRGDAAGCLLFDLVDADTESKNAAVRKLVTQCGSIDGVPVTLAKWDSLGLVEMAQVQRAAGEAIEPLIVGLDADLEARAGN